ALRPGMRYPAGIPDGTSNTIAVVEVAEPVIWTKPADVDLPAKLNPGDLKKKFGGQFPGGFNVAMWDGSVRFVPDTVSERTLANALNPRDGQVLGADWDSGFAPPPPPKGAVPPKGPVPPKRAAPPVPPSGR